MISVHETEKLTLEQIEKFLLATDEVRFEASKRAEVYSWVEQLLCQQEYSGAETSGARSVTSLHREDDGAEPGADDAVGRPLRGHGPGGDGDEPSPSLPHPLRTFWR